MSKPTPLDTGYWTRNPDDMENFVKLTSGPKKVIRYQVFYQSSGEWKPFAGVSPFKEHKDACAEQIRLSHIFPTRLFNLFKCEKMV